MRSSSSLAEYQRRLAERKTQAGLLDARALRISNLRLLAFVIFLIVLWLAVKGRLTPWWVIAPSMTFIVLLVWHDRVSQELTRAHRAIKLYEWGIARIEDRWHSFGRFGERFRQADHVYAEDLDLFGERGLFQMLSGARTRMGEETLAAWLLAPVPLETILERQKAIAELRSALDFREELAVFGEDIPPDFDLNKILKWAEGPELLRGTAIRIVAPLLAVIASVAIVVAFWKAFFIPAAVVILAEIAFQYRFRHRIALVIASVEGGGEPLLLFSSLLKTIEKQQFDSPLLQRLRNNVCESDGQLASKALALLSARVDLVDSRHNVILHALNIPWLYELQVAFAVEAWRHRHGHSVRKWLDTIGELEALLSLAAYSYEHPADPFPEFVQTGTQFHGKRLGHPLIAADKNARNSVRLDSSTQAMIVSGSNMSGKSTYLRTLGVNAVLAMAGATVRADSLRLTPLQLGSSLHIVDSLQTGRSGFASELERLRQVMALTKDGLPVFFLIDEVLHGTNSHDRHLGGQALLRSFLSRGAIGVITTHDLSITEVPPDLKPIVSNAHFEDRVENGRMVFDYQLREGVVTRSNALELMRAIGLDV